VEEVNIMMETMILAFAVASISMLMERGPTFSLSAVTVKQLTRQQTNCSLGKDLRTPVLEKSSQS